ncbi:uncharacterized protein L969DRAFT_19514 [Mixia osmundae IAM 14324]|uniref:Peptidase A1 domain-containing protein n=1 Tax=Mixia osmundae (strain CBS 9802 / IAM 14324 / JCM 22182 / KY 12970) TaxID=764103 RepID=G7DUR2_MIXOS|nr:uncharacterized protein L969DRAFT_19514 [Mixia osmundae IAM 14324]KEI37462.1 hypothetical protein L969DRAFT_19514 [Mixia osmundae IAM 14324]GAA94322.1 hypothetical protein E5Q_00972 [Mixia osmundae IAM 14324]
MICKIAFALLLACDHVASAAHIHLPIERVATFRRSRINHTLTTSGRRRLLARNHATIPVTTELSGQIDLGYYVMLSIGTPAQQLPILLDSGSADFQVQIYGNGFQTQQSSTFQDSGAPFQIQYASGSASGTTVTDVVALGPFSVAQQAFGAITSTSEIVTPAVGILGLGFEAISSNQQMPWAQNLIPQLDQPLMAFYFSRTQGGSTFSLGATDQSHYSGEIEWVPVTQAAWWQIEASSISVNGQIAVESSIKCIIDTGSSYAYTTPEIAAAIYAQIEGSQALDSPELPQGSYSIPCDYSGVISLSFGTLQVSFNPQDLNIGSSGTGACVGGIIGEDLIGGGFLLGDVFIKAAYLVLAFQGPGGPPAVGFAKPR